MNHLGRTLVALLVTSLALSGCDLIGDVIEFGFWAGVIVVALVALAVWLLVRTLKR